MKRTVISEFQKSHLLICCPQETHFKYVDRWKVKGRRKINHANSNQRTAGMGTWFINNDFKPRKTPAIKKDTAWWQTGPSPGRHSSLLGVCAQQNRGKIYKVRADKMQGETDSTAVAGDFNTPLSWIINSRSRKLGRTEWNTAVLWNSWT